MDIKQATLEDCGAATGTVVVIDVVRAFTTAAFAFAAGARDIVLVSGVDEAFALHRRIPGVLLMGEVDGIPVPGFDFGNSPAALRDVDLTDQRMIQRTSRGTQGVVFSTMAESLLAASFVCARATVREIQRLAPRSVTIVVTGVRRGDTGDEDVACADYIKACLRAENPDVEPFLRRVRQSSAGRSVGDPGRSEHGAADLACCLAVDRFDFAMAVERRHGLLLMKPVTPP